MRAPKGFGKNYFTLNAIQAYVSTQRLGQNAHRVRTHRENRLQIAEEADNIEEPPPDLLSPIHPFPSQGGLCNCRFARLSHLCLRNHTSAKKLTVSPIHTHSTLSPPRPSQRPL